MIVLQVIGYHGTHTVEYRIARSYGDVYYVVAGVLWERGGDDGVVWVLVPVGDVVLVLR